MCKAARKHCSNASSHSSATMFAGRLQQPTRGHQAWHGSECSSTGREATALLKLHQRGCIAAPVSGMTLAEFVHWLACTRRRLVLLAWYPLFFMLCKEMQTARMVG